ncbi:MAG: hypothetical protein KKG99_03775 [Bacteroidetes bacterium]|nr:hypothetical protein [Bacteroidota bacterium]
MKTQDRYQLILRSINYNLKIIFANKFIFFLIAAIAFYLMVIGIMLFDDSAVSSEDIFSTLIFPGILILFYPVIFNIQNDKDARMLEIIFGIPNYRYKVYLVRFAITMVMMFVLLMLMGWFAVFAVARVNVIPIVYQLMYPLLFLSGLAFMFSTLIKNANSTAAIMVIIGLTFLILAEPLQYSKWNIFLNPYNAPSEMSQTIWQNVIRENRIFLLVGTIISILWSLTNLQRRERFV